VIAIVDSVEVVAATDADLSKINELLVPGAPVMAPLISVIVE